MFNLYIVLYLYEAIIGTIWAKPYGINRRNMLLSYVPLDSVGNSTVLSNPSIAPITTCYFDREVGVWKPFDYETI